MDRNKKNKISFGMGKACPFYRYTIFIKIQKLTSGTSTKYSNEYDFLYNIGIYTDD
jgi:hypothetical protein